MADVTPGAALDQALSDLAAFRVSFDADSAADAQAKAAFDVAKSKLDDADGKVAADKVAGKALVESAKAALQAFEDSLA